MAGVALAALGLGGCGRQEAAKGAPTSSPPRVAFALPVQQTVQAYEDFPGRISALESVEIKARVTGYLKQIHFVEGTEVSQGSLLYSIDAREYEAAVEAAAAALEQAKARLKQALADQERAERLKSSTVISAQEFENQLTSAQEARAGVRAAEAALARATLNLEFTEVRAPIGGKISRTAITVGNLVGVGDSLTTLVRQNPIYVYFEASERVLARWDRALREMADGAGATRVLVGLGHESSYTREGRLDFTDNALAAGTGTLRMRAVLANDQRELQPGMYARVRVFFNQPAPQLLVPDRALVTDQGRRFVYVVNSENQVEYRPVVPGQTHDGRRVILDGLRADDRVITEGQQLLRPGMRVSPEPAGMAGAPVAAVPPVRSAEAGNKRP